VRLTCNTQNEESPALLQDSPACTHLKISVSEVFELVQKPASSPRLLRVDAGCCASTQVVAHPRRLLHVNAGCCTSTQVVAGQQCTTTCNKAGQWCLVARWMLVFGGLVFIGFRYDARRRTSTRVRFYSVLRRRTSTYLHAPPKLFSQLCVHPQQRTTTHNTWKLLPKIFKD